MKDGAILISSNKLRQMKIDRDDLINTLNDLMIRLVEQQKQGFSTYEWDPWTIEKVGEEGNESYVIVSRVNDKLIELVTKKLRTQNYDVKVDSKKTLAETEEKIVIISWENYMTEPDYTASPTPEPVDEMREAVEHLEGLDPGPGVVVYGRSGGEAPSFEAFIVFDKMDKLFFQYMLAHCPRIEEREDGYVAYAQSLASRFYTARQAQQVRDRFINVIKAYVRPYSKEDTNE